MNSTHRVRSLILLMGRSVAAGTQTARPLPRLEWLPPTLDAIGVFVNKDNPIDRLT